MCKNQLESIVKTINEAIQVDKIFKYSVSFSDNTSLLLMIVLPDTFHSKVDEILKPFVNMVLLMDTKINYVFIKKSNAIKALSEGNLFFHLVFTNENLLFESLDSKPLPAFELIRLKNWNSISKHQFLLGWDRIRQFMFGAYSHFHEEHFELAAFNLHQVAELTYRLFESAILVFDKHFHLIRDHCHFLQNVNPFLAEVFPTKTKSDLRILQLLDKSYSSSRYDVNFKISPNDLKIIFERVDELLRRAQTVFDQIFISVEALIMDQQNQPK